VRFYHQVHDLCRGTAVANGTFTQKNRKGLLREIHFLLTTPPRGCRTLATTSSARPGALVLIHQVPTHVATRSKTRHAVDCWGCGWTLRGLEGKGHPSYNIRLPSCSGTCQENSTAKQSSPAMRNLRSRVASTKLLLCRLLLFVCCLSRCFSRAGAKRADTGHIRRVQAKDMVKQSTAISVLRTRILFLR
jgi:hypothetical protein